MNSALEETLLQLREAARSTLVFPVDPPDGWFPRVCKAAETRISLGIA